jgi:uncharacterized membrane protein (UPF0127 family)
MTGLYLDGSYLAEVEVADTKVARTRGLLGRPNFDGALLLTPALAVHTLGMSFPIDVAYLSKDSVVLAVRTMTPTRVGRPRLRARAVLEAQAGAFERWGIRRGVVLEAR